LTVFISRLTQPGHPSVELACQVLEKNTESKMTAQKVNENGEKIIWANCQSQSENWQHTVIKFIKIPKLKRLFKIQ